MARDDLDRQTHTHGNTDHGPRIVPPVPSLSVIRNCVRLLRPSVVLCVAGVIVGVVVVVKVHVPALDFSSTQS